MGVVGDEAFDGPAGAGERARHPRPERWKTRSPASVAAAVFDLDLQEKPPVVNLLTRREAVTRWDIEAAWPLVVRHRAKVVRYLDYGANAHRRKVPHPLVVQGYDASHDIPTLAATHGLSPSGISSILTKVVRVARGIDNGTLRFPKRRKKFTLTLTDLSARWIVDVDQWAAMRGLSRREAATELVRIGIDITPERVERQLTAALASVRRVRTRRR